MGLFGTIGYWLSGLLIWAAPLAGVAGLLYAVKRYRGILVESVGSEQMAEQQKAFSKRFDALLDSEKNAFLLSV